MTIPNKNRNLAVIMVALKDAEHELVLLNGMLAADGAAPTETFTVSTDKTLKMLGEAIIATEAIAKETLSEDEWVKELRAAIDEMGSMWRVGSNEEHQLAPQTLQSTPLS